MIKVEILADSISENGHRITTGLWTYPRFIHSEVMTHRMLAKNSASSRAIPVRKILSSVIRDPAVPEQWGKNQKGMQASVNLSGIRCWLARQLWLKSRWVFVIVVWFLSLLGLHKQVANRLLESWMHMTIVITGTEWSNFFALRAHKDADPTFQKLAYLWLEAYLESTPTVLKYGEWHLPFVSQEERSGFRDREISAARCARVSYTKHGLTGDVEADLALCKRLSSSGHFSPFEHQATPFGSSGCFRGWRSFRSLFTNENQNKADLHAILKTKPHWIK